MSKDSKSTAPSEGAVETTKNEILVEGTVENTTNEIAVEGPVEGLVEGVVEVLVEGPVEGVVEGLVEGLVEGVEVRFLLSPVGRFNLAYSVDEIAFLPENQATELVEAKYAEFVK